MSKQRTPKIGDIVQFGLNKDPLQIIAAVVTAVHERMMVELTTFEPRKPCGCITQSWTAPATGERHENDYRILYSPDNSPQYGHWNYIP